ncbi:sigma-70 family RNA polymerase sigma factor [Nocardia sp. NPDC127579]|uniref:sigma-70 family RNA polymerase sigma factor n=1 Tax=Nocardia sp. NPDC127579 TaxID=3345402 RepID=UPI00363CF10F
MESDGLHEFQTHRPRLFALAYRMLGSAREAEDAVREAGLRWSAGRAGVRSAEVWLTATVANLCRARLVSAQAHRADYAGAWLPEPVPTAGGVLGPLESVEEREQVSLALLTVLERLEPAERAILVLREGFGYAHREIADMLELAEAEVQRAYRRARARAREGKGRLEFPGAEARARWERLLRAARAGAVEELAGMLAADIAVTVDSGGRVGEPVAGGAAAARFLVGLFRAEDGVEVGLEEVNGGLAAVGRQRGRPVLVLDIEAVNGVVGAVRVVLGRGKLAFLAGLTG